MFTAVITSPAFDATTLLRSPQRGSAPPAAPTGARLANPSLDEAPCKAVRMATVSSPNARQVSCDICSARRVRLTASRSAAADRLNELADVAELMDDFNSAVRLRRQASELRIAAMRLLDE